MNVYDFVEQFSNKPNERIVQFAKIDASYVSGRPLVTFDGETQLSGKAYPYLSSYTPKPNERVMLVKGVIVGKIL